MDDENPFRSPQPTIPTLPEPPEHCGPGLWRDGHLLVLRKDAALPDRCVTCNEPAGGRRLRQKFYWHPPVYFVVILLNPLIYAILAIAIVTSVKLELGICERHERRRRHVGLTGLLVASIGMLGAAAALLLREADLAALVVSVWIILLGFLGAIVGRKLVSPKRIGNYYVWLKGVHPDYRAEYPDWTSRLTPCTKRRMHAAGGPKSRSENSRRESGSP